ncbi:unnamed protein product [Vicia faba]|uniref:Lyase n=1 Tax=Vicia faba TaxID=3906 RepID=A0AAV0YL22_VICFA|nr:unnamed protein product [Vicia faba]
MSVEQCFNHDAKYDLHRNVADFQPSVWGNYFLQYASDSEYVELDENIEAEIKTLKYDVRKMLVAKSEKPSPYAAWVLAITLKMKLKRIWNIFTETILLRQQGLHVSPNVFNKYMDDKGNFSETLINDVEGMLSLYEATHLMIHGEDILEEALAFTTTHLESIANQSSHSHAIQVKHSLRQAIHKNIPRLEARRFISIYEQDPFHIENLLLFAKLNFNMLQSLHKKEFGILCKWWNDLDVHNKLPYARDRLTESCFWALTIYFEPQYSTIRKIMMKLITALTIIDDTYDAYRTIDELELFTKAIERWDICGLDNLPDYMKFLYRILFDLNKEIEEEAIKEGIVYAMNYYKNLKYDLSSSFY